jgi:hypothetical protein
MKKWLFVVFIFTICSCESEKERSCLTFKSPNNIAWAIKEARQRLMNIAIPNIRSFLNGNPVNVV